MARGLKVGPPQEADIVALAHDGRGIARIDGKAIFVAGALKGERAIFRVVKRRRRMDEADLIEIVAPAAERAVAKCAHFGVCGGCTLQHLAPAAQIAAKQAQLLDDLTRIGRVSPRRILEAVRGPEWGYRRRARLGVKYVQKKGRVLAGFREKDKPYLADIRRCEVLIESFGTLPEELATLVGSLSIREHLPQVELAAGDDGAALVMRVMQPPSAEDLAQLADFGARRGVQIHLQSGGPETIRPLGPQPPPLRYAIEAFDLVMEFGPSDFVQINRSINASMIDAAVRELAPEPGEAVLDLFCGLGNFTLPLARRASRVVGIEADPALIAKARANGALNGIENASFHADNLFDPKTFGSWAGEQYQRVLLDPPRAGAREVLEQIARWRTRRVVYISCHTGSLARDAGILVANQGFELIAAGVMDMFPHTTHVESIAVFERRA